MAAKILDLAECEISEYEKIFICSAAAYMRGYPRSLTNTQWLEFAQFLSVNTTSLLELLESIDENDIFDYSSIQINDVVIDLTEYWLSHDLFACLLNYYNIYICLNKISYKSDKESFLSNRELYQIVAHNITMMNINSGTFECICNGLLSRENAPQSFKTFHPNNCLDILELFSYEEHFKIYNNRLQILYRITDYELKSHANSMYIIVVSQILKHASFSNESIRSIGAELYENLHFLLKDARLITIHTNHRYQDLRKKFHDRTRRTDNTTRLHLLYGFDNYDSYSLRLDLPHEGIGWIHYNNCSPGGVKSHFFTESEFEIIVEKMPRLKECFINYGDRWFLKEIRNCALNLDEKQSFEKVRKQKEHTSVFKNVYSEENVLMFLSIMTGFVSPILSNHVDKNGQNAKQSFNYDKLMMLLKFYHKCKTSFDAEATKQVAEMIVNKGINCGIILPSDKEDYSSEDGILMIIDLAQSKCFPNKT